MPEPKELRDLDRAVSRVDKQRAAYRQAIAERNTAVEKAKAAGHPAGMVYRRAKIAESTASRARRAQVDANDSPDVSS